MRKLSKTMECEIKKNTLLLLPSGIKEIIKVYGNPDKDGNGFADSIWESKNLVIKKAPFSMRISWNHDLFATRIKAHKLVIDYMIEALEIIRNYQGLEYLRENDLDLFGGAYMFRKMTGQDFLSSHSWGIAIDYCPHLGQMEKVPTTPGFIVQAFKDVGFEWGGDWKIPDGMHFQACTGY